MDWQQIGRHRILISCQSILVLWHRQTEKVMGRLELEVREQELKCLELCMDQLSPGDRDVVTRYHQGQGRDKIEARRLLSDGLGGVNALRIRMYRIRKELRVCIVQCTKRFVN
jgi:hypothetical protein